MRTTLPIVQSVCQGISANRSRKKTCAYLVVLITLLFAFPASSIAQNKLVPFTFSLRSASTTSAGIFKKDSTLVRTLWNNVKYAAGTHTAYWDRKDDDGLMVSDTGFILRVMSNNVSYTWDGAFIGNSSDSMWGTSKHQYFARPNGMVIYGNFAYYSVGYAEGAPSIFKLNKSKPQSKGSSILYIRPTIDLEGTFCATDGNYVYWSGYDPYNTALTCVYATTVANDKEVSFSSGSTAKATYGRNYASVIDLYTNNAASRVSGLAVQKNGPYLFVAHEGINELHVLNKTTGALVQNISVTRPRGLCMDMNDKLWMISSSGTVEKYDVDTSGTLSAATLSISNLSEPLAMAVSPNNYLILIADGGTSQQLKAFNNTTGSAVWTLGQAGGYATDPKVMNDKFFFSHSATEIKGTFVAYDADSSFWFGDPGNERIMHFSASRNFIKRIMSLPHSYCVQADKNDPTRVFNEYLEFKIDYSKTLAPDNGSWTLVRNWRHGITSQYYQDYKAHILRNVITLSNGRTYATMDNLATKGFVYPEIVELPDSGNLRYTGIKLGAFENFIIDSDGSLRTFIGDGNVGKTGKWNVKTLLRFDSNNNPVWGTASTITTTPVSTLDDPLCDGPSFPAKTTSDVLVIFNPWKVNDQGKGTGYHLGGMKKGSNKWLWKAAKATVREYKGPLPTDGNFDIGNNVEYPGGNVYAIDQSILWNYHGEFWKNSQTNIWNHYYDNGLMLGQFGTTNLDGEAYAPTAYPQGAGNVFSAAIVKVGSDYYLYHNDESLHAGVHRWKISGLNSISVQSQNISLSNISGGLSTVYFDDNTLNNVKVKASVVSPTVNMTSVPVQVTDSNNYSVRWTGFVRPDYSENYTFYTNASNGVKLWINGYLVIDQWGNNTKTQFASNAIALKAAKKYTITMEINGGKASLSWASASRSLQIIPASALFPANIPEYSKSLNLLEGLTPGNILANNMYGWTRNSTAEDNTSDGHYWQLRTGIRSFDRYNTDLSLRFRQTTNNYYASRELQPANTCLSAWKVYGKINFEQCYPQNDNAKGGVSVNILDNQNKIIASITHEITEMNGVPFEDNMSYIKINGKIALKLTLKKMNVLKRSHQPFSIAVNSVGDIVFSYANSSPVTVKRTDTTSNWTKPTTFRVQFTSRLYNNYDWAVDFPELIFEPLPTTASVTPSGATTFCQGQSVTLTANNANTYLWNNNATTKTINVNTSGTYSVKVKDLNGCETTLPPVLVTVNPLPNATITASGPSTFCQGATVTLTAPVSKSYLWSNNASTRSISVSTAGNYSVTVTDSNTCSSLSAQTPVVVNPVPVPKVTLMGTSVSSNYSSGNQWYLDGALLSGQVLQTCPILRSGNYGVVVTNSFGCKGADILLVPLPISDFGVESECLSDREIQFNWQVTGEDAGTHYTISYSSDQGKSWSTIGTLKGDEQNQSTVKLYTLNTSRINMPGCFYKWSAIGSDGEVKKSHIMAAPDCGFEAQTNIFPNPFNNRFSLDLPVLMQAGDVYQMVIVNDLNQMVHTELLPVQDPENGFVHFEINNLDHLNNGLFLVRIEKNGQSIAMKTIIKMN